jgi:signal transduction histidine kinase
MKNKIALKLAVYFSAMLLLFAAIIGGVFTKLFSDRMTEIQKRDLEKRAAAISEALSEYLGGSFRGNMGGGKAGLGAYLMLMDEIAMTDIWIVDEDLEILTTGRMIQDKVSYKDLPADAEAVVKEVFKNKTTFSEGFSPLLNASTLTVGTPIRRGEEVVGALLLHTPVSGINEAITSGVRMLSVSMAIALLLSVILAVVLAMGLTKPLKNLKETTLLLAGGDYSVKTRIKQKDEVGELAAAIDILSERLDTASRESEQLQKLRRDFVANVSHELRTPVTVIRGSVEALLDGVVSDPGQVKTYCRQMLSESVALQRLVDDLLELSRLQNTEFKFDMRELNFCGVVEDAVRSARAAAAKKNIEIDTEFDTSVYSVTGDYGRLRQMLLIILDNAVKFSPESGRVEVSMKGEDLIIRDRGSGISEKDIPYIFERFYRTKSERNADGTGLGLAIAKQIADRHNFSITVAGSEESGTEFRIGI